MLNKVVVTLKKFYESFGNKNKQTVKNSAYQSVPPSSSETHPPFWGLFHWEVALVVLKGNHQGRGRGVGKK